MGAPAERICVLCMLQGVHGNYVTAGHQCVSDELCKRCGSERGAELIEVGEVGSGEMVFVHYPCGDKTCQTTTTQSRAR